MLATALAGVSHACTNKKSLNIWLKDITSTIPFLYTALVAGPRFSEQTKILFHEPKGTQALTCCAPHPRAAPGPPAWPTPPRRAAFVYFA